MSETRDKEPKGYKIFKRTVLNENNVLEEQYFWRVKVDGKSIESYDYYAFKTGVIKDAWRDYDARRNI